MGLRMEGDCEEKDETTPLGVNRRRHRGVIQDKRGKALALSEVAEAIFHLDHEGELHIFYGAFNTSRYGGSEAFFQVLDKASKPIAAIDGGKP